MPEVDRGQILVKIEASGVCHTDARGRQRLTGKAEPTITNNDDVLRDGERIRVPWSLMDSMQPAIKQESTTHGLNHRFGVQSVEIVDAFGRGGLALRRPGFRYLSAPA